MSDKNTNREELLNKLKEVNDQAKPEDIAADMASTIAKMCDDRDDKVLSAKERLILQLGVTVDKYRTANGVMSALDTVRLVMGRYSDIAKDFKLAKRVATKMALVTQNMLNKANTLEPEKLDTICDGFYNKEFSESDANTEDMVLELMILQLCQNVGPSASDVTEFITNADMEIEKARADLLSYCEENDLDFDKIVGE